MLTCVYDQVCEIEFYVANINLVDEKPMKDGTQYEIDLVPCYSPDCEECVEECPEIRNVPLVYNEKENTYYIADISAVILEAENNGLDVYDYNSYNPNKPHTTVPLYEANYSDGLLTSTGATNTEPCVTVSIYQADKDVLVQEATTIADLIEILEYANTLDYTEIVVSGAFTSSGIKRSK